MPIRMDKQFLYEIEVDDGRGKKLYPCRDKNGNFSVNLDGRSKGQGRYKPASFDELLKHFAGGHFQERGSIRMKAKGAKGNGNGRSPTNPQSPARAFISESFKMLIAEKTNPKISSTTLHAQGKLTGSDSTSIKHDIALAKEQLTASGTNGVRQAMSIEELRAQLDRRSEIGAAGERIAFQDELQRLRADEVGCPDPGRYVKHVALTDVGRGYDVETTWPGHERCIEVKSSTSSGNAILMSDNEWTILKALGKKAWLYRVVVDAKGSGGVVSRLNDPISLIPQENVSTAVWRVHLPKQSE